MNTTQFKRRATAVAVSTVLTAGLSGVAYAADVSIPGGAQIAPTLDGAPFIPAQNTDLVINGNLAAAQTQDIEVVVVYLDDGNNTTNQASATDAQGGGSDNDLDATVTGGDPGGATKAIIVLDVAPGDSFGVADGDAAWVDTDGTVTAAATRALAEDAAIAQYNKLIKLCDGVDYVTQDLCIQSLSDEEDHRRDFMGYLTEYEKRA